MYQVFLPGWEIVPGRIVPGFWDFWFSSRVNSYIFGFLSAFGNAVKKNTFMIGSGLSNITYRWYHANFIYCTVVENSFWVLNGLNPRTIYHSTTGFVCTLHILCTRFYVPGFGLYQVFFYQVFCLFWNVPGFKVPGISKKYQV